MTSEALSRIYISLKKIYSNGFKQGKSFRERQSGDVNQAVVVDCELRSGAREEFRYRLLDDIRASVSAVPTGKSACSYLGVEEKSRDDGAARKKALENNRVSSSADARGQVRDSESDTRVLSSCAVFFKKKKNISVFLLSAGINSKTLLPIVF